MLYTSIVEFTQYENNEYAKEITQISNTFFPVDNNSETAYKLIAKNAIITINSQSGIRLSLWA
jgi:hypothetical protein